MAERDERHRQMGNTRYVVEPNIKDGKGGLRDLNTLFWIGKYFYHVKTSARAGRARACSARDEYRLFQRPRISSGRCAATCISSPAAPRRS